jgi:cell division protein FtsL
LLNKKRGKPDLEKTFEQIQKKEKFFTSVMNVIFFVIIVAVMMIVLSIVSSL